MEPKVLPEIDLAACDGCGRCLAACQHGALGVRSGKAMLLEPDLCRYDGNCELACPTNAIRVPYSIVFGEDLPGYVQPRHIS